MEAIAELFHNLESNNPQVAEEAKTRLHEHFNSTKESWLINGIFDYYLSTGSIRSIDVMVGVREPHERYLFDRLSEALRSPHKLQALTLLGHVVRKHPSWLYKIMHHSLLKELLRLLKFLSQSEKDVLSLMSALLIVIILLPIIAGLISPHLQDLFEIFSNLASWNTKNPNKVPESQLLHLQVGLYALFNRLYGMFPCNFLNYLRVQYSSRDNQSVFSHTIKPMLDTVKMHPLLVTASKETEVAQERWKKMEANDVIMECAKFSVDTNLERCRDDHCSFRARTASFRSKPHIDFTQSILASKSASDSCDKLPVVGSFSVNLPNQDVWSPTVYIGPTTPPEVASITHTPKNFVVSTAATYSSQEGNSPPEAAIEATPESTPVKDLRQPTTELRRPSSSAAVRSLSSLNALSQPSSPFKFPVSSTPIPSSQDSFGSAFQQSSSIRPKETTLFNQRVQRVNLERVQNQQAVDDESSPFQKTKVGVVGQGCYSPGSPLRLITPSPLDRSSLNSPHHPDRSEEDREVETTMRTNQNNTSITPTLKRTESIKQEEEHEEMEECASRKSCMDGGLHMPDRRTMAQLARSVNRYRFHSQCQPDSFQLAQIGVSSGSSPREGAEILDTKVRRAVSCPEMKKDGIGVLMSELGNTVLNETEEDELESPESVAPAAKTQLTSSYTQTDEFQPLVYEHLFLSVFPPWEQIQQHSAPPEVTTAPLFHEPIFSPRTALESYIATTLRNLNERKTKSEPNDLKGLKEQIELLMYQLQFERHRREVHAERNRRLLGKSRTNRALEEHNKALMDQVVLMQREIEDLHLNLEKSKQETKQTCDQMQQNVDYWKEQCNMMQRKHKESEIHISLLEKELEEQKKTYGVVAKEHALAQSQMLDLDKSLQDAQVAANSSEELKSEIAHLQHHLAAAGELEARLRSTLNTFNLHCHKDMESILNGMAYTFALSGLKAELKNRNVSLTATKQKIIEIEKTLAKQQKINHEKDELISMIRKENSERHKALELTVSELKESLIKKEEKLLSLQSQVDDLTAKCEKQSKTKESGVKSSESTSPFNSLVMFQSSDPSSAINAAGGLKLQTLQHLVDENDKGTSKEHLGPL